MSQVLQFGLPTANWLLCENPVCTERATVIATISSTGGDREICGCDTHISQLLSAGRVKQYVKLKTPGLRNEEPK